MLFLNFFGRITNREPDLFRVSGRSRACGHGLFSLSASTETQSSGQNGHDHDYSYNFQSISPPFAASCRYPFRITREATFLLGFLDVLLPQFVFATCDLVKPHVTTGTALFHTSITTGVPSSTKSNSSITSAFSILTQPQLSGVPILCSCFVPWM